jgi:hypothetical protein
MDKNKQKQLITEIMNEDAKDGLYKKQTAVDWLFHKLWNEPKDKFTWYAILKDAKEMEKKQIVDAYCLGHVFHDSNDSDSPEEYYNTEYGTKLD